MQLEHQTPFETLIDKRFMIERELESGSGTFVFVVQDLKHEYKELLVMKLFAGLDKMYEYEAEITALLSLREANHSGLVLPYSSSKRLDEIKVSG